MVVPQSSLWPVGLTQGLRRSIRAGHLDPAGKVTGEIRAIAAPGQSLDKLRLLRAVVQKIPQAVYGLVETMFKSTKVCRPPKSLPQLFSGDQLAGPVQQ